MMKFSCINFSQTVFHLVPCYNSFMRGEKKWASAKEA